MLSGIIFPQDLETFSRFLTRVKFYDTGFTYGREVLTVVFIFYCQCGWIIVFPTHILSRPPQSFRLFATVWPEAARLLSPWDSLGRNTGMGCHALLQQIFPNQGLNSCLLHYMQILYH